MLHDPLWHRPLILKPDFLKHTSSFFSNALSGTDMGDHDSPPVPIFRHPQ